MLKRIFGFFVLVFALFGTQSWAAICSNPPPPTITAPTTTVVSCTNRFSPTVTTATYDFRSTVDGYLILTFPAVNTTFDLTVAVDNTIDAFDTREFPLGTTAVTYCSGNKDQYDFTGNAGGPNGVPVKGRDYQGLIHIQLTYCVGQTVHTPAFAHAPGLNTPGAMFEENIITGYARPIDDTMDGLVPGLSSIAAADEPLTENDTYCWVSPMEGQTFTVGQTIEVSFQLFAGANGSCPNSGTPIRDKTAQLFLSTTDTSGNTVFPARLSKEEGNKFHWDNKNGVNEFDLSTEGLQPRPYTITVISSKSSPESRDVTLMSSPNMICLPLSSGLSCF
jgi:hypothetical protein